MLDTRRPIETPEGVELGLRVAGPVPRLLAWAIDFGLRMGGLLLLSIFPAVLGGFGLGIFLIAAFLGEWFYPVYFEVRGKGATPGKRWMGLVVLNRSGTPVDFAGSMIRNLVRFADLLPIAYGFGLVSMLLDRDFRRLGDLAAGTMVVHGDEGTAAFRVGKVLAVPPPCPLDRDEQRALIEFAERIPTWSDARAEELAGLLEPLTGATGKAGLARIVGMANWLLGRR